MMFIHVHSACVPLGYARNVTCKGYWGGGGDTYAMHNKGLCKKTIISKHEISDFFGVSPLFSKSASAPVKKMVRL